MFDVVFNFFVRLVLAFVAPIMRLFGLQAPEWMFGTLYGGFPG